MNNIIILIVAMISGLATYTISTVLKKGTVFASATVILVAGILIPYFFNELGSQLAGVAACASYAGMASTKVIPRLREMLAVSAIAGSIFVFTLHAYEGVGGKLGTIAAISCFTLLGVKKILSRKEKEEPNKVKV